MSRPCNLGVGCEQAGVCFAAAHGEPDQCGSAANARLIVAAVSAFQVNKCPQCGTDLNFTQCFCGTPDETRIPRLLSILAVSKVDAERVYRKMQGMFGDGRYVYLQHPEDILGQSDMFVIQSSNFKSHAGGPQQYIYQEVMCLIQTRRLYMFLKEQ